MIWLHGRYCHAEASCSCAPSNRPAWLEAQGALEHPDRVAVRNAGRVPSTHRNLVAHAIRELVFDLLVRKAVEPPSRLRIKSAPRSRAGYGGRPPRSPPRIIEHSPIIQAVTLSLTTIANPLLVKITGHACNFTAKERCPNASEQCTAKRQKRSSSVLLPRIGAVNKMFLDIIEAVNKVFIDMLSYPS
jgi:hypothetical protein